MESRRGPGVRRQHVRRTRLGVLDGDDRRGDPPRPRPRTGGGRHRRHPGRPPGHPAARLLEIAHDAELLVLGYRGRGGFAGLRLGSAGQRVATHASGPVAVVRGHPSPDGPVVAGVDGSAAADHVLESAFTAAGVRAARLIVVRSVAADRDAADGDLLHEQLAPWRDKFPDVAVETLLTHDDIAPTLVSASAGAQLVMVGSRGRGAIRGALLGSTGLHLLQHAECPVLLARPCAGDRWAG
ncbi:universal stress protein [Paractinoplanes rhizophilus]|uniref:Universal stress protein n=1 Tax=Paractinoplanes rhizophilus TaxID=1416877 RepID=A0ABW2I527_9ACTN